MTDSFGDRMKSYERQESGRTFIPMLPVYARIDGRTFTSFTKGMNTPLDSRMSDIMVRTSEDLLVQSHAKIAYTQSDEISLVWMADHFKSSIFFNYRIARMTSVLASLTTALFMKHLLASELAYYARRLPHFDCRVFQLPNVVEAANVFLWREQDATRNAITSAARAVYSHSELQGKNCNQMQEMLFQKGINFNDYPTAFKRGTFIRRIAMVQSYSEEEQMRLPEGKRDEFHVRHQVARLNMPKFGTVCNREAVIFEGAEPALAM